MSTPDFFRSRLDAMIDLRHPLAVLANRMPWSSIEATLTPMFERRAREGRVSAEIDLFGVTPKLAGAGVSAAGRPRLSVRLMVGLLYLKHAYNESDESVCERWAESVYLQYFHGEDYVHSRVCRVTRPTWYGFVKRWAKRASKSCWRRRSRPRCR